MDVILFLTSKFENAKGRRSKGDVPSDTRIVQNWPGRGLLAAPSITNCISYMFSQHGEFKITFVLNCFMQSINIVGFYCK
jgi:hypothetical protein